MDHEDRPRGHATRAHTADVVIEAWGPTREACLEEAVLACAEVVAVGRASTVDERHVHVADTGDDRTLVALLGEVITLLDSEGLVPVAASVEHRDTGLTCLLSLASLDALTVVGPSPKGVSYDGLELARAGSSWLARAILDV